MAGDGKKKARLDLRIDRTLLFVIIFLLAFGLVMIYSVSSYEAYQTTGKSNFYLVKQLKADLIGMGFMLFTTFFPYNFYKKKWVVIIVGIATLVSLSLVPFIGIESHGAKRWLPLFGRSLTWQPAELAKIAVIMALAYLICYFEKVMVLWRAMGICFLVACVPAGMVAVLTNNVSSAIIILGIAVVMIYVSSRGYKKFAVLVAGGSAIVALFLVYVFNMSINEETNFRFVRILAWRNPEKYAQRTGFQTVQALYAIGSGGFFGKGLGQSMQKLGFIPEAQNDMIFSVICEELGFFGAMAIMLLFMIMIWRMVTIATQTKDLHGALIVTGVIAQIAVQVILNIAVVTNTIPNTGISLPFISYGGTSVLFLLSEMGIVLNIGHHSMRALDKEVGL